MQSEYADDKVMIKFSIRYKILSMVTALVLAAIVFYLMLTTMIFRRDKMELVFDLNKSVVSTLATEVDSTLRGVSDKLRLYAYYVGGNDNKNDKAIFKQVIADDPLLVRLELFDQNPDGKFTSKDQITDGTFEKTYGLASTFFTDTLTTKRPIPFSSIRSNSATIWNATVEGGPPLLGMGIPVIREGQRGIPDRIMAAIGYVKADVFIKNMKSSRLNQVYILDQNSRVLVHVRPDAMLNQWDYSKSEIVHELKNSPSTIGVTEFKENGRSELGAFAKVSIGNLSIVSQVESERAFMAVRSLIRRSFLYAMIIATITFIATVLFSRTLTRPLFRLMMAMERVSNGKLDTEIRIKSMDEIAVLSQSFNRMTQDLKSSRMELEEVNRDLEQKVVDRTKKLEDQNRAVKEAQEALLRTTRLASVGEIAGRTAHEVLNPLTTLMARTQKMQKRLNDEIGANKKLLTEILSAWKKDLDEKGVQGLIKVLEEPSKVNPKMNLLQEDLSNFDTVLNSWDKDLGTLEGDTKFLMQQAIRIEKILRQMRSLSVVSSNMTLQHIHPLVHDAINIVADLFARSHVEVKESFSAADDGVKVDRDELIQVMTNMLRNCLQAVLEKKTDKRVVEIHTSTSEGKFFIDIIDNGIGITEQNKPKLFESQFSTKGPEEGTGLGLSISRRFVRAFNGDLYLLKSTPDEGTTFRIELPLHEENKDIAA